MSGAVTHRPRVCGWPLFVMPPRCGQAGDPQAGTTDILLYLRDHPDSRPYEIAAGTGQATERVRAICRRDPRIREHRGRHYSTYSIDVQEAHRNA